MTKSKNIRRMPRVPRRTFDPQNVRVSGTETLISGLATTTAYTLTANGIRLPTSLPFNRLNSIASNWGLYRFVRLRLRYSPVCGSTTAGRVAMTVSFDIANDTNPGSILNLLEAKPSKECVSWKGMSMNVPCNNFLLRWYPYGGAGTATDITDPFVTWIATDNGPATSVTAGNVYMDWEIELSRPISIAGNP